MAHGDSGMVRKRVGGVNWEMPAEMEEILSPILDELGKPVGGHDRRFFRDDPRGASIYTVKTNRPGLAGELFVKVHRWPRGRMFQNLLRGKTNMAREWKMAAEHARLGIPAPAYLARGERRRGPVVMEEFLIQESLTSFESFDEFFRTTFLPELPGARPQDKRTVIRELAALIRGMHDRGVARNEIEPRNIMAAPRPGGGARLVMRDLEKSRLHRSGEPFGRDRRIAELARFHMNFGRLFSQSYRIRFYREYFAPDNLTDVEFRELVKKIVDLSSQTARNEEPRILSDIEARRYPFFWFEKGDRRVYLRKPLYQNSLLEALAKTDGGDDRFAVKIKRVGEASPREYMAVRCEAPDFMSASANSAARRAFYVSAILDHHGIGHFNARAAAEKKDDRDGWIFISIPVRGEYNLAEYLARRVAEEFSGIAWDRKFLIRVARFLLALHEAGWYFPEPTGDDLWVRYTEEGRHEIRVFNLHRLARIDVNDGRAQLMNLLKLWTVLPISQADGLMLAEEYIRFQRLLAPDRGQWIRRFREWQLEPARMK